MWKIAELDGRKQELVKQIAELTVKPSARTGQPDFRYLDTWDDVSFDDKRRVVDLMITTVAATSDSLEHYMENLTGGNPPVRPLPV